MAAFSKKLSLSVRERLLLHLLSLQHHENDFEVPVVLTQAGISSSTGIARPNVSRAMKLLSEKDVVYEKLAHIKGHKRQKKIYLLTNPGLVQARELKTSLERLKLKYRTAAGKIEERTIGELSQQLPRAPSIQLIITNMNEEGEISHDQLIKLKTEGAELSSVKEDLKPVPEVAEQRSMRSSFVYLQEPISELRHFFGREKEHLKLKNWLEADYPRVIMIFGLPGIGKTTLALETVRRYRGETNIFWYGLKNWDTLANIIKSFTGFLTKLDRKKLEDYNKITVQMESAVVADLAAEDLAGTPAIIVIDDFQNSNESIKSFFSALIPLLQHQFDIKIILLSRQIVKFYDRRDVLLKKNVVEFKLEGLDQSSSRELINIPDLAEDEFNKIYTHTGGHPLYLELLDSVEGMEEHTNMHEFIHEEIFSKLKPTERKLLEMGSVYRYPVHADAFFEDPKLSYGDIDSLVERSYLVRSGLNMFSEHDLIKSFFYNRLTKHDRVKYHKFAVKYYSNLLRQLGLPSLSALKKIETSKIISGDTMPPPKALDEQLFEPLLEIQYHLMQCSQSAKALEYTLISGKSLIDAGKLEFLMILDEYDTSSLKPLRAAKVLGLKGEILTYLGEEEALPILIESLKKYGKSGSSSERALICTLIGENYAARDNWVNAEKYHRRAKSILDSIANDKKSEEDKFALARSYNNMGLATKNKGDLTKALELYENALVILENEDIGTVQDRTAIQENIGLLLVDLGQFSDAKDYFEAALVELESAGDNSGLAKLFATLGDIYVDQGDIQTATEFFEKGVHYWELAEDMGHTYNAFLKLGQAYSKQVLGPGSKTAGTKLRTSYWDRLQNFFSTTHGTDAKGISRLYDRIGSLYMRRGHWHKSLEFHLKALDLFEKLKDDRALAKVYNNLGVLYRTRQEPVKALEYYKKAVIYLEKLNEAHGLAITHLNIGRLYERLDDSEQSKRSYKNCLELSSHNEKLKNLCGLALLGLARQSPPGTSFRNQYLLDAQKIFKELNDTQNLNEIKTLQKIKNG